MNQFFLFLKHFLRAPRKVGSVLPSSSALAKVLVYPLQNRDFKVPLKILEIGAGTGAITEEIEKNLNARDQLDILEVDSEFIDLLKNRFHENSRIQVFKRSILEFDSNKKYDFILSSLPLNAFTADQVQAIFDKFIELSKPGSIVSYFEFLAIGKLQMLFSTKAEKENLERIFQIKNHFYKKYPLEKTLVWTNLPPAKIFHQKIV